MTDIDLALVTAASPGYANYANPMLTGARTNEVTPPPPRFKRLDHGDGRWRLSNPNACWKSLSLESARRCLQAVVDENPGSVVAGREQYLCSTLSIGSGAQAHRVRAGNVELDSRHTTLCHKTDNAVLMVFVHECECGVNATVCGWPRTRS